MRGTHSDSTTRASFPRFIPAYAGNTGRPNARRRLQPVHPRVCGEHKRHDHVKVVSGGSSPRMRGTREALRFAFARIRFIPAYAGNTPVQSRLIHPGPVHPRVCGEHFARRCSRAAVSGSSPRMRGTRLHCRIRRELGRFIPAYAGNTVGEPPQVVPLSVHPRVCGEHPPPFVCRSALLPVHPRVCGEHPASGWLRRGLPGSSPRMRGTLHPSLENHEQRRFIPAYAGNTRLSERRVAVPAVHPRVCGEHSSGSPPIGG